MMRTHLTILLFTFVYEERQVLKEEEEEEIQKRFWQYIKKCLKLISLKLTIRVTFVALKLQISFCQDS